MQNSAYGSVSHCYLQVVQQEKSKEPGHQGNWQRWFVWNRQSIFLVEHAHAHAHLQACTCTHTQNWTPALLKLYCLFHVSLILQSLAYLLWMHLCNLLRLLKKNVAILLRPLSVLLVHFTNLASLAVLLPCCPGTSPNLWPSRPAYLAPNLKHTIHNKNIDHTSVHLALDQFFKKVDRCSQQVFLLGIKISYAFDWIHAQMICSCWYNCSVHCPQTGTLMYF